MLELAGDFDAFLCGDDAITRAVLEKSRPRLKVVAKYGIGLDKVDVAAATENLDGGARSLRMMFDKFGTWELALAKRAAPGTATAA